MAVSRRALVIGNGGYRGRLALRCPQMTRRKSDKA